MHLHSYSSFNVVKTKFFLLSFYSSIVNFSKAAGTTRLVSLLQPGPETFSLFDEVILLAEGRLIYSGPIDEVVDYFASLGYKQPNTMDVADFLQSVATPDGAAMFHADKSPMDKHYSAAEFAEAFQNSTRHNTIVNELSSTSRVKWSSKKLNSIDEENPEGDGGEDAYKAFPKEIKDEYKNSFFTSTSLIVARNLTLLKRNKEFLIGKSIENFGMGIGMALIFLQSAAFPSSINGSQQLADFFSQGCPENDLNEELSSGESFPIRCVYITYILMFSNSPLTLTFVFIKNALSTLQAVCWYVFINFFGMLPYSFGHAYGYSR